MSRLQPPAYKPPPSGRRNWKTLLARRIAAASPRGSVALGVPALRMNGWERAYAERLAGLKACGEVVAYWYEGVKLRLADATFYTPDFLVLNPDSSLECHEVKGFWRDDARVKVKVAAAQYRGAFVFVAATRKRRGSPWKIEVF